MYKKTVKYTDYNGIEREEDFYFSLSEAELTEMQVSTPGGYNSMIDRITKTKDVSGLVSVVKDLVIKSFGVKSDDGRRFIKKPELVEEFMETPAYSNFYMSLISDEKEMAAFINNIIPSNLMAKMNNIKNENSTVTTLPSNT